jgi:hypothetical protein
VVDVFPEIISPTITTDEDGNEAESPNIWRNSQETA